MRKDPENGLGPAGPLPVGAEPLHRLLQIGHVQAGEPAHGLPAGHVLHRVAGAQPPTRDPATTDAALIVVDQHGPIHQGAWTDRGMVQGAMLRFMGWSCTAEV